MGSASRPGSDMDLQGGIDAFGERTWSLQVSVEHLDSSHEERKDRQGLVNVGSVRFHEGRGARKSALGGS